MHRIRLTPVRPLPTYRYTYSLHAALVAGLTAAGIPPADLL